MVALDTEDTIAAIASAPGSAFRGILRVSGQHALKCLETLFQADDARPLSAVKTTTSIKGQFEFVNGNDDCLIPGTLLVWPTNRSFTRQPTAEFHTIGSTPILQMILEEICKHGARLAKPGEFTLRAFLSGRIDLTQAEAVLAIIDASGEEQLNTALAQLAGGLAGPLGAARESLISTLAELEAGLDFVEEDIEFISKSELIDQLSSIQGQLKQITDQISNRNVVADAARVALIGMPNTGKSSLFNALTKSDDAIVTDVQGTTTDFITAPLQSELAQIELIDTAGFEDPQNTIEQQAQSFRSQLADQSVLRLLCIDHSQPLNPWELDWLTSLPDEDNRTVVVLTKCDLSNPTTYDDSPIQQFRGETGFKGSVIETSSKEQTGLEELRRQIAISVLDERIGDQAAVSTTILRASESLRDSLGSVEHALDACKNDFGEEIVAAEIRQALEGLSQVVGTVYTDDILDLVFGRFCIGK